MQVGVSSTQVPLPSSRWSALTPTPDASSTHIRMHPLSKSTTFSTATVLSMSSSTSRRKPKMTFRSPDASTTLALKLSSHLTSTQTPLMTESKLLSMSTSTSTYWSQSTSSATMSTSISTHPSSGVNRSTCSFFTPAPPLFKMPLAYPSYHPFSPNQLLLAANAREENAARRNAATNGGNDVDDKSIQGNEIASNSTGQIDLELDARRSSSRTRRPVAKLRDGEGEGHSVQDTTSKDTELSGTKSPKRKRAGGNGNGSRKKRKEAPTEVQPRRERQRRGAAAAAAAAITESAEAQAAGFDNDAMDVSEPAATPAASVDESATTNATPEAEEKDSEETTPKDSNEAKNSRAKRVTRPKRSRAKPSNDKEVTPTRQTRQSRRRASSSSGSDAAASNVDADAPAATPTSTPSEEPDTKPAIVNKAAIDDEFTANIDPALLDEGASSGSSVAARSASSS